jgi:signal peptidase II
LSFVLNPQSRLRLSVVTFHYTHPTVKRATRVLSHEVGLTQWLSVTVGRTLVTQLFVATAVVLFVDQWTKTMVQGDVVQRRTSLEPRLRIRRVTVRRDVYSRRYGRVGLVLLWCVAMASAIVLYRSGIGFQNDVALWGLGAAIGGAAGNLLDIMRRRAVVDFIDLGWWPVFNLADVGIIAGLAMAFWRWS